MSNFAAAREKHGSVGQNCRDEEGLTYMVESLRLLRQTGPTREGIVRRSALLRQCLGYPR